MVVGASKRRVSAVGAAVVVAVTAGCSLGSSGDAKPSGAESRGAKNMTVTLVTHESWAPDKAVMAEFTKRTGYTVKVQQAGDAGALANKLVLSKDNPTGDVVFGIDNTFASRVAKAGVVQDYSPKDAPADAEAYALPQGQGRGQLAPIDHSGVCVNVDDAWFTKHHATKPANLDDLVKPEYKNLMVAPGAATSSPGMAFLLSTIARKGENGWKPYWQKLMSNGLKLTSGWSDAWNVDYTAGSKGKGTRPVVVSYDSSPGDTLDASGRSTTSALLPTCFRSVEYAGVLKGAKNPEGAKAFVDFLNGTSFQKSLPESMYVFPLDKTTPLPKSWAQNVKQADAPAGIQPKQIDEKRETWLTQWKDVTSK